MQSRYGNYQQIYTDGSKEDSKVGCAVISDNHSNMQRIPDDSSIFTAEAKAIDLALDFICTCDANNKFIIFYDSLSVLKAMNHTSSRNPQIHASLTADPGVASSIPARSHTFVEIDHEIISTVILLPSAESFKKGCCQLQAKVCARSTG